MKNEWDDYAAEWDHHLSAIEYAERAFAALKESVKLGGLRVLDFGCGTGLLSERLSPVVREIVALDGSPKMIEQLNRKALPNISSLVGFLNQSLIAENHTMLRDFDLVVASSVCSFLPNYEATLSLLASVMKPDGVFVQWDWLAAANDAEFGLSEERVANALAGSGLGNGELRQPFTMESSKGSMPVLMAMATKPHAT